MNAQNEYESEGWIKIGAMRPGGAELTKRLLGLYKLPFGSRILDVACGLGDTVAALSEMGYSAIGVDVSQKLIAAGRRLYPGAELIAAAASDLPFSPGYFDALIIQCSLGIIGSPPLGVLKDGGILYISDVYGKDLVPRAPPGCDLLSYEDVSGILAPFAAKLIWDGVPLPYCLDESFKSMGYYIMAARKREVLH